MTIKHISTNGFDSKLQLDDIQRAIEASNDLFARFRDLEANKAGWSDDPEKLLLLGLAAAVGFMQLAAAHAPETFEQHASRVRTQLAQRAAAASMMGVRARKADAMREIKQEWLKRKRAGQRINATTFAKEMATKHKNIVTPEYLKNQQTRWNKEYHPAS